jgi:uncharacterized membrane protein YtjA (UPF0391 family)
MLRTTASPNHEEVLTMPRYALVFAILAVLAGLFGFIGLSDNLAFIARVLLFLFLAGFVLSLVLHRRSLGRIL